uniref:Uncharacterized protein n=1 Tax=Chromera velia CCMP2878 TaxID=1169474 RepID=A0A0K6SAT9_9ALVE|eukprot:Cvel_12045.t2-p1 / transcript=Cvel_12045.t2 / gene=Cvel_12045 / organism=Chromera_velia_CCMP2878 / gene_product=hypothetical protein / transcript_product=hypothetical protein / location=Cvel_scaffold774:14144-16266(+) / protein_length=179 / sequence_SO=supercontig / SO=protein_coding / is_pseudo=false
MITKVAEVQDAALKAAAKKEKKETTLNKMRGWYYWGEMGSMGAEGMGSAFKVGANGATTYVGEFRGGMREGMGLLWYWRKKETWGDYSGEKEIVAGMWEGGKFVEGVSIVEGKGWREGWVGKGEGRWSEGAGFTGKVRYYKERWEAGPAGKYGMGDYPIAWGYMEGHYVQDLENGGLKE